MGHTATRDAFRSLGDKIDNLSVKAPWNEALHRMIKEFYTEAEADLVVKMPYVMSSFDRVARITGWERARLKSALDGLAEKGMVIDVCHNGQCYYMPSPIIIGIFEFTMMRTRGELNTRAWAGMLHAYMSENGDFNRANFGDSQKISIARAIPHSGTVAPEEAVEILSYEKAEAIIHSHNKFSIGTCSCRHKMLHLDLKKCNVPLDTCSSFGYAAEYTIRRGLAREVSRGEMLDNLARSRELGLVLSADNVKRNITFICSCCSCCCHILEAVNKFGYRNFLVTSTFTATVDPEKCTGCSRCARACPVNSITMESIPVAKGDAKDKQVARIDNSFCLGCGVCALQCGQGALQLKKRKQKVIHPDTTFERNILQCLERGNLQNYIFDNPQAVTHKVMRGIIGGFLKLSPVKRALMSDTLRSRFLSLMTTGATAQGNGWMTEV